MRKTIIIIYNLFFYLEIGLHVKYIFCKKKSMTSLAILVSHQSPPLTLFVTLASHENLLVLQNWFISICTYCTYNIVWKYWSVGWVNYLWVNKMLNPNNLNILTFRKKQSFWPTGTAWWNNLNLLTCNYYFHNIHLKRISHLREY